MTFLATLVALALAVCFPTATGAAEVPVQVTDDQSGSGCLSVAPVSSASAGILAWESSCDPAGSNNDGSYEIFRALVGQAPFQLTNSSGCSSTSPSISASGDRIAFESDCNLTGANSDGNVEIFLWTSGAQSPISQLTVSVGCDNRSPSLNGPGTFVAFDSTCNINGTNNNGRGSEIYRVSVTGELKQLTVDPNGGMCDSTSASIDDAGTTVAFDSDCDLAGSNEDLAVEIFSVNTNNLVVKQRTVSGDDDCISIRPSIDASGSLVAFYGDCDLTGANGDHSVEVFTVEVSPSRPVRQVTDTTTASPCDSGEPRMASSGLALAFTSYCNLTTGNADGSFEVFQAGLGAAASSVLRVTDGKNCSSVLGGLSADGSLVAFDSDCDPSSNNADASVEIFRGGACSCGAPATRRSPPLASDAQFALRAAVGSASCTPCQCDVNQSGSISAGDSLTILNAAVGQPVVLNCPEP